MWSAAEISGTQPTADPVVVHHVDAGYAPTMGLRLVAGRLLNADDVRSVRPLAVVNERFVSARLGGRPPLGQSVRLPRLAQPPLNVKNPQFDIVGIVADTQNDGLADPIMPEIYVPFTAAGIANWVVIRANVEPGTLTRAVSNQVYAIDQNQPVANVMTLETLLKEEEYAQAALQPCAPVGVRRHRPRPGRGRRLRRDVECGRAAAAGDWRADGARRQQRGDRADDPRRGVRGCSGSD